MVSLRFPVPLSSSLMFFDLVRLENIRRPKFRALLCGRKFSGEVHKMRALLSKSLKHFAQKAKKFGRFLAFG